MKKSLLLAIFILSLSFAFAQNELLVQTGDKGLYLNHTVVAKENFYSIGRLYNISPKEIESFNGIKMADGLSVGQTVRIPLNPANFSQSASEGRPVFYVVGQKEGLYRVSLKNNEVLMANLRKWNRLSNDNISTGQKLIVGYLVSPEANNIVASRPEPVKEEVEKETNPVREPVTETKEAEPKREPEKKPQSPAVRPVSNPVNASNGEGGYFKAHFEQQVRSQPAKKDETASAGIFKTASGWQDGKYYVLIDGVEPGTIIKVTNPTNSKSVYAKVLGQMSGIRQNQGYDVRISNAAASALEVTDTDKFIVKVNY